MEAPPTGGKDGGGRRGGALAGLQALPAALRIALRRLGGNKRLMAAVAIGVILAVALMSSTAIYRDSLRELGLQSDLSRAADADLDVRVLNSAHPLARDAADETFAVVDRRFRSINRYLSETNRSLTSATFFMTEPGGVVPEQDPRDRARVLWFEGVEEQIRLIDGRMPDAAAAASADDGEPPVIEVSMGAAAAEAGGFELGERREIHASWRDDARPITIELVGLVEPLDYSDRWWAGRTDHFRVPEARTDAYAFFAPQGTIVEAMGGFLPGLRARLQVHALVDRSAFRFDDAPLAAARFRRMITAVSAEVERTRIETEIVNVLNEFQNKEFFSSVPLLVLTLQIVGIVLFYLVLVSTMVVERQGPEVALLKSRGAGLGHILSISALEGVLLVGLAVGVGPILAREAIALLGFTGPFEGITGGARLTAELTWEAYMWAGIGAALSFIAVMWPAWRSNRATVVRYARASSRPQDRPAFQRYYLDLVVVGVGALLFFQLQQSGSLVTEDLFGGLDQDPLLMIAPAVFVVTVAVVFLRLFPLLLRGAAWIAGRLGGASLQVALWHLTRAPLQPGRLALLLIMATSLGMFGGTFGATLSRSFDDRASYEAGAALRLADIRASGASAQMLLADVEGLPGVETASAVARVNASSARGQFNIIHSTVLAVEPETFGEALWYRGDFAAEDISAMLAALEAPPLDVDLPIIPAEATHVGMWIWLGESRGGLTPFIRIEDGLGRIRDLDLAGLPPVRGFGGGQNPSGWRFLRGSLRSGPEPQAGPWRVHAFALRPGGFNVFSGAVVWDQMSWSATGDQPGELEDEQPYLSPVLEGGGENEGPNPGFTDAVVIEDFEEDGRWVVFTESRREPLPDSARLTSGNAISGERALRYSWTTRVGSAARGVRAAGPEDPVPVLASRRYLEDAELQIGDEIGISTANTFHRVRIAGEFDLFPSWYPDSGRSLIVVNREYFAYRVNRNPATTNAYAPNELWLGISDEEQLPALHEALAAGASWRYTPYDAAELRRLQNEDPLVAAGWEGLLLITFIAIVILSALGFLVASILAAQQQAGEFAVLRTMGFSLPQVLIVVGVEKLFIIAVSMALGTLIGLQLGVMMLEFVGFDVTGEGLVPPFVTVTDWGTIGGAYGVLGLVFLSAIAVIVALYMRMAIGQVLRIGAD